MKKTPPLLLLCIFALYAKSFSQMTFGAGQTNMFGVGTGSKVIVESGDLSFLKDQKNLKVQYVYDGMAVGIYKTEKEYIKIKMDEYNKKEAGKGDKWLTGWKDARKQKYEPKFEDLLNKTLAKKGVIASQDKSAKYILTVRTTYTEPGHNVGISKQPSFVNLDFIFTEAADTTKEVAKLYVQRLLGAQAMGFDFDAGSRIAESYAKGGKYLSKYLIDNVYKKK